MLNLRTNLGVSGLNDQVATVGTLKTTRFFCLSQLTNSTMQAGQLEASYAIKFGIRLGNNAAETYEMVNTVCGQAIMSWASV